MKYLFRSVDTSNRKLIPGYKLETSLDSHDPEKVISNFSCHTLSDVEQNLLCKGLRFALPL